MIKNISLGLLFSFGIFTVTQSMDNELPMIPVCIHPTLLNYEHAKTRDFNKNVDGNVLSAIINSYSRCDERINDMLRKIHNISPKKPLVLSWYFFKNESPEILNEYRARMKNKNVNYVTELTDAGDKIYAQATYTYKDRDQLKKAFFNIMIAKECTIL